MFGSLGSTVGKFEDVRGNVVVQEAPSFELLKKAAGVYGVVGWEIVRIPTPYIVDELDP